MLTRLKVSGFKNLVDADVWFGPFTCGNCSFTSIRSNPRGTPIASWIVRNSAS